MTVDFSVTDKSGNPLTLSQLNSLSLALASPTTINICGAMIPKGALATATSLGKANYRFTFPTPYASQRIWQLHSVGILKAIATRTLSRHPHSGTRPSSVKDAGLNQVLHFR